MPDGEPLKAVGYSVSECFDGRRNLIPSVPHQREPAFEADPYNKHLDYPESSIPGEPPTSSRTAIPRADQYVSVL